MITIEQIRKLQDNPPFISMSTMVSRQIIFAVIKEIFPEQLLADWEKENILKHCAEGRKLEDCYGFSTNEGAIYLEFPELYDAWLSAKAETDKATEIAEYLLSVKTKPLPEAGEPNETL